MKSTLPLLALGLLSACHSTRGPRALRLGPPEPVLALPTPVRARAQSEAEQRLSLWTDPAFQKRFVQSFIAQSEVEPSVTSNELPQLEEVRELFFAERFDRALEVLRKGNSEAASAIYDFYIGNIHFQREEYVEAEQAYLTAVEKYPKFLRAWKNLGLIQVRQDDFASGVNSLTHVLQLGGNDADIYGLLGFAYANLGDHLSAESAFRMAALLDPANMDWKMSLARSFFDQKRYAEAASLCGYLIEGDPSRAELWLLQANAYIGMGKPMDAAENLELVERMGRSTPEGLFNLGDIYINQELFDLGVQAYVRALEGSGGDGSPARAVRAARHLAMSGALEETRTLMESVRDNLGDRLTQEDRKDLLKLEVRMAVAEGSGEAEAGALERIIELDPLDGEAILLLGKHHERKGDYEQAAFLYQRAGMIEEFTAPAKVDEARLLVRQQRYDEALPLLREAQVLRPRDNVQAFLEDVERAAKGR